MQEHRDRCLFEMITVSHLSKLKVTDPLLTNPWQKKELDSEKFSLDPNVSDELLCKQHILVAKALPYFL